MGTARGCAVGCGLVTPAPAARGAGPDPGVPDAAHVAHLAEQIIERAGPVRRRIEASARGPVRIVAVTKGHPVEVALATMAAGFEDLGENYAQELRAKAVVCAGAVRRNEPAPAGRQLRWHFVGRLQSNKVRMLAPHVALWQSLDRDSVIDEVARRAPGAAVLVQVDLAGVEGRGGCPRHEAGRLVQRAVDAGLRVRGLMGVGPMGDPEDSREGFRWLRGEVDALGLEEVSMGMSGDLDVAVAEGATMVRIGTALLGTRPPRPSGPGGGGATA